MLLFIIIGVFGMIFVIGFKQQIVQKWNFDCKLTGGKWFQNYWKAGLFLLVMNAVLFFGTIFLIVISSYFGIPYVHVAVMCLAVLASLILWISINLSWKGTKRNRLKMSAIGSSFYLILAVISVYFFVTLEPSYPGEDTFMKGIGFLFSGIVTTVALITNFIFTGFSK